MGFKWMQNYPKLNSLLLKVFCNIFQIGRPVEAAVLHRDVLSFGMHKTVLTFWKKYSAKYKSLM